MLRYDCTFCSLTKSFQNWQVTLRRNPAIYTYHAIILCMSLQYESRQEYIRDKSVQLRIPTVNDILQE